MNEWPASVAATVAAIEAAFDGRWGAWLSDTGWWWAARTQVLTAGEHAAGCLPYIHADNPDELTERIRQQDELTQPIPPEPAGPVTPAHGSRHQPGLPIRHQAPVAGEPMTPASTVTRAATTTPPRTCERVFAGRPEQVREARKFVAAVLDGCPAADDVILCISELASNAVLHSDSRKTGCTFTVRAEVHQGDHIRVEVEDNGGPWENRADHDGRPHGLDIIASLAADWAADGSPLT